MRRFGRIFRWASYSLLFVFNLEIAARVDDWITYGAPFWSRYDSELLREFDAAGVPKNREGAQFEKWRINSLGFRGSEVDREKPAGRRRIVCLGQSETFGLYEREGGEWPSRLAQHLHDKYPSVDVINASVVGTSRNTREAYLEKYVFPFHPDVIVLYLNILADGTAPERSPAVPPAVSEPPPKIAVPALAVTWPQSRLLPKLKPRIYAMLPESLVNIIKRWSIDRKNRKHQLEVLHGQRPRDVLPNESVVRFDQYVRQSVRSLRDKGISPVLATYPTLVNENNAEQYHVQIANERAWYIEFSERGIFDLVRKMNSVIRQVASDLSVPLADVDATMPKTLEYFGDYNHYNDAGAEFVARSILEVIEKSGLAEDKR